MAAEDPELIHPHDFFRLRERSVVPDSCFMLMPFGKKMTRVYEAVRSALANVGVTCNRADTKSYNGTVLDKIMQNISNAEFIIADLTDCKPNVVYELGLAHVRTKDVVLIATRKNDLPFNMNSLYCHFYGTDLSKLQDYVRSQAAEIRGRRVPTELKDRTERTRQIVNHLRSVQTRMKEGLVIRQQAAMSSLSNVGPMPHDSTVNRTYYRWLRKEQAEFVNCLRVGASAQLVVTPLAAKGYGGQRWQQRASLLAKVLETKNLAPGKLDIAMMPYSTQNLLFIGDEILFEGHKTSVLQGGFQLTSVYTNREQVVSRRSVFTTLFASACDFTQAELKCAADADSRRKAIAAYLRRNIP